MPALAEGGALSTVAIADHKSSSSITGWPVLLPTTSP